MESVTVPCPHCHGWMTLVAEKEQIAEEPQYTEHCSTCRQPILLQIMVKGGKEKIVAVKPATTS